VPARFWWWASNFPRDLARMLPSPPWSEIESNYVGETRVHLADLSSWRRHPPSRGRLLPWHGEPGNRQDQRHTIVRRGMAILGRVPVHHGP
jgi:hypothetical protein